MRSQSVDDIPGYELDHLLMTHVLNMYYFGPLGERFNHLYHDDVDKIKSPTSEWSGFYIRGFSIIAGVDCICSNFW